MAEQTLTLSQIQEKLARRAWENPEFEAEFMADPKGTFEKYTGQKLPPELKIHAHYNSPDEIHFVLPRRPEHVADELTDEDLERVAGGETAALTIIITFVATVTVVGAAEATIENQGW